jgi:hypothetical protein
LPYTHSKSPLRITQKCLLQLPSRSNRVLGEFSILSIKVKPEITIPLDTATTL